MDPSFVSSLLPAEDSIWEPIGLAVALVVLLPLVRRFGDRRRARLGRPLLLFGLHLLCFSMATLLHVAGFGSTVEWLHVGQHLFAAFVVVSLAGTLVFDLFIPAIGLGGAAITYDLLSGLGYVFAGFSVFSALGVDLTSVVAASTIAAAILSISLQNTLGNVVGGIALQLDESVHVGDWLQLENGKQGQVKEIRWRHTVLQTRDGDAIVVPNATLLSSQLVLLGRGEGKNGAHRMTVTFQVDQAHAPDRVCRLVQDALRRSPIENVADEPRPDCVATDLARDYRDGYIVYAVRYWIQNLWMDDATNSRIRARIHAGLAREGIDLGRPLFQVVHGAESEERARRSADQLGKARRAVRDVPMFEVLHPDERDALAAALETRAYAVGETITRQGDESNHLYLLVEGEVDIRHDEAVDVVAILSAPDFFGEMGLLTGEPRQASVVARTPVICQRLGKDAFHELLRARPEIAQAISERLAQRQVGLGAATSGERTGMQEKVAREQARLLARMRQFFGLDD